MTDTTEQPVTDPTPEQVAANRIAELEATLAAQDQLSAANARIAELEKKLSQRAEVLTGDGKGNPTEPTHLQVLACGCSQPVIVPAATLSTCAADEAHGLQAVTAHHELVAEPA